MMDPIIGIASFVLALAQSVVLTTSSEKRRTFFIASSVLFILFTGYSLWSSFQNHQRIAGIENDPAVILSSNNPRTVEQLADRLNENRKTPVMPSDLDDAIEARRAKGTLCSGNIETVGPGGRTYVVRVYNMPGFGTC